jgi:acetyl-CoA C-acetyltransferase
MAQNGLGSTFTDAHIVDGVRTPFADYNGALANVSPIDLGIKAARAALARAEVPAADVGSVIAGSMAQASFDAFMLPRHVGLYAGVPVDVPAHQVQRVCGTGIEVLMQAADTVTLGRADVALAVGTESMSRNPVAAYTHRGGFRLGQVEFKDFLWEALLDTGCGATMGDTAETLARQYQITRPEVDAFAARSFSRALAAQESGFLAGEIAPVTNESFEAGGLKSRGIRLKGEAKQLAADTHVRPSPVESLAKIKPAFGGVQTGGNSSAIVDGAAAAIVASTAYCRRNGKTPLARIVAGAAVGVPPEIMGIGPVPATQKALKRAGLAIKDIDVVEINEAFASQAIACMRELGIDEGKANLDGGAIALGHPLGATGARITGKAASLLKREGKRYALATQCIGGGQGIATILESAS